MEKLFFDCVLSLSAAGSAAVMIALAAERLASKHLRKSTLCDMWRMVMLFYIFPFGLLLPKRTAEVIALPLPKIAWPEPLLFDNVIEEAFVSPSVSAECVLCAVWIIGAVVSALYHGSVLLGLSRIVKRNAVPCERWEEELLADILSQRRPGKISLRRMNGIDSPVLFGLLCPVILLPGKEMPYRRLRLALMHESAHLARRDLWYKRLSVAVCAVYWFSPFAYVILHRLDRLCEFACDERVADSLNDEELKEYAYAILESAGSGLAFNNFSTAFSSGAGRMKRRLEHIMNIPENTPARRTAGAILTAGLLLCGALVSSACTAQAKPPEKLVMTAAVDISEETKAAVGKADFIAEEGKETVFSLPVGDKHYVSLEFGSYGHEGIDFVSENEGPIYAAADGVVVKAENDNAYGNYIIIDHGDGMQTLYAHCSELIAAEGDEVTSGAEIAKIGSTGQSTGPHLHFELRINGEVKDPADMLF